MFCVSLKRVKIRSTPDRGGIARKGIDYNVYCYKELFHDRNFIWHYLMRLICRRGSDLVMVFTHTPNCMLQQIEKVSGRKVLRIIAIGSFSILILGNLIEKIVVQAAERRCNEYEINILITCPSTTLYDVQC